MSVYVGLRETGREKASAQPWPLESFFFVNLVWFAATEQNSWSLFLLYEPGPGGDSYSERVFSMTKRKKKHTNTQKWTRVADKGKDLKVRRKPGMAIETHTKQYKVLNRWRHIRHLPLLLPFLISCCKQWWNCFEKKNCLNYFVWFIYCLFFLIGVPLLYRYIKTVGIFKEWVHILLLWDRGYLIHISGEQFDDYLETNLEVWDKGDEFFSPV